MSDDAGDEECVTVTTTKLQAGKPKATTILGVDQQIVIICNTAAAACAIAIEKEGDGGPKGPDTNGLIKTGGRSVRLEATWYDFEKLVNTLRQHARSEGLDAEGYLRLFKAVWKVLQTLVSSTGGRHSVATALEDVCARVAKGNLEKALLNLAKREMEDDEERPQTANQAKKARQKENKKKADEKKKKDEDAKKKKAAADARARKANSTGKLCHTFYTSGACRFNDSCIHFHPKDRNVTLAEAQRCDGEDVRGVKNF